MKYSAVAATFLLLGLIGGSYKGFCHGQRDSLRIEQIAKGALAVHYLGYLEDGELEISDLGFELYIDAALERFYSYENGELSTLRSEKYSVELSAMSNIV